MKMERLDPLQRLFVDLEDTRNVNTHQIVVIRGHLELSRLRKAIHGTVRDFELCTAGLSRDGTRLRRAFWVPEEVPCHHHVFPGTISFANPSLRRALMHLSRENPIRWRRQPPLQVFYMTDAHGARSALMLNCHHGIADARSDELLLTRLIQTYAALATDGPPSGANRPPAIHPYVPYLEIEARTRAARSPGRATFSVLRAVGRDLMARGTGVRCPGSPEAGNAVDFLCHELDSETDDMIRDISRRSGQTINSVITAALYRVAVRSHVRRSAAVKFMCPVSLRGLIDERYGENFQNLVVPCSLTLESGYASSRHLLAAIAKKVAEIRHGGIFTQVDRVRWLLRVSPPVRLWLTRLIRGSNACYSNPGVIGKQLDSFGSGKRDILQYAGFGCLISPHDFILYTPEFRGRLHLDVVYRTSAFSDVDAELLGPLRTALVAMADEFMAPRSRGQAGRRPPTGGVPSGRSVP